MAQYILFFCLCAAPFFAAEPVNKPPAAQQIRSMKLINLKYQSVIVEFREDQTIFHDKILENEMKERGILIPPAHRNRFGGKSSVRLHDPEFQAAFKEIFSPTLFNLSHFEWRED